MSHASVLVERLTNVQDLCRGSLEAKRLPGFRASVHAKAWDDLAYIHFQNDTWEPSTANSHTLTEEVLSAFDPPLDGGYDGPCKWAQICTVGENHDGVGTGISTLQDLMSDDVSMANKYRLTDNPYHRQFRTEAIGYKPYAWRVISPNAPLQDVMIPDGAWNLDGHWDGDTSLMIPWEYSTSSLRNVEPLLRLEAQQRLKQSGKIILGPDEEKLFYRDEVESLLPVKSFDYLMVRLNQNIKALPQSVTDTRTPTKSPVDSSMKPPKLRRPPRLYPLMINQHPVIKRIRAPIKVEHKKRLTLLKSSVVGLPCLEEFFIIAEGRDQETSTEPAGKTGVKHANVQTDDIFVTKPVRTTKPFKIEVKLTRADDQPVEEQPVEEQPVEEQPVEEQPVEEQPVEEQPVPRRVNKERCPSVSRPRDWKTPVETPTYTTMTDLDVQRRQERANKRLEFDDAKRSVEEKVSIWRDEMHQRILEPIEARDKLEYESWVRESDQVGGLDASLQFQENLSRVAFTRCRGGRRFYNKQERRLLPPWRRPNDTDVEAIRLLRIGQMNPGTLLPEIPPSSYTGTCRGRRIGPRSDFPGRTVFRASPRLGIKPVVSFAEMISGPQSESPNKSREEILRIEHPIVEATDVPAEEKQKVELSTELEISDRSSKKFLDFEKIRSQVELIQQSISQTDELNTPEKTRDVSPIAINRWNEWLAYDLSAGKRSSRLRVPGTET